MKNLAKLKVLLLIVMAIIFNSCKKDPIDLENSYMDIIYEHGNGLWVCDNTLRYVANLSPNTLTGEKVNITYTSEADTVGFTIESVYYNTILDWGRDQYNIQRIDRSFEMASFTDADKGFLKVNPAGDKVTIKIGDAFSEIVNFEGKQETLVVANFGIRGNGLFHGEIKLYNESGVRPEIKVYSQSHTDQVTLNPDSDLGDNGYRAADPSTSEAFGYTIYSLNLVYDPASGSGYGDGIIVNEDSDTFYAIINGKTYSHQYDGERIYNSIMTPIN